MKHFKLNEKVRVNPINDNENYNDFKNKVLVINNIARNEKEHRGYDSSVSPDYLYHLRTLDGEDVNCSLYDYELIPA